MTTALGLLLLALVYGAARIMERDASLERLGRLGEQRSHAPDALPLDVAECPRWQTAASACLRKDRPAVSGRPASRLRGLARRELWPYYKLMPKFIGNQIEGATRLEDNLSPDGARRVRLSYSQAVLLPPSAVMCSLDTSDRGSRGSLAKRWYSWFASAADIIACPRSTRLMRDRATEALRSASLRLNGSVAPRDLVETSAERELLGAVISGCLSAAGVLADSAESAGRDDVAAWWRGVARAA